MNLGPESSSATRASSRHNRLIIMESSIKARIAVIIGVSCAAIYFGFIDTLWFSNSVYVILLIGVFLPATYFAFTKQSGFALISVLIGYWIRSSGYLLRRGLTPGFDNYKLLHRVMHEEIKWVAETGQVAYVRLIHSLMGGDILAPWNLSLIASGSVVIISIFLIAHAVFGDRVSGIVALLAANDFAHLLYGNSLLKTNVPIISVCVLLFFLFTRESWPKTSLTGSYLLLIILAIPLFSYTGVFIGAIILGLCLLSYAVLTYIPRFGKWSDINRGMKTISIASLLLMIVVWAVGSSSGGEFGFHLRILAAFLIDLLGGDTTVVDAVSGNEFGAFTGSSYPWYLAVYQWVYRLAMLLGALLLIREILPNKCNAPRIVLVFVGTLMTGLPIIWLILPTLSNVLHAGRVSRWALIFYSIFIAVLLVRIFYDSPAAPASINTSDKLLRPFLVVILLSSVLVGPSALKTSENYAFDSSLDGSADRSLKSGSSLSQLRVWNWATTHSDREVAAPGQFRKYALMSGIARSSVTERGSITILKEFTLMNGTTLIYVNNTYVERTLDVSGDSNRIFVDGRYVVQYRATPQ